MSHKSLGMTHVSRLKTVFNKNLITANPLLTPYVRKISNPYPNQERCGVPHNKQKDMSAVSVGFMSMSIGVDPLPHVNPTIYYGQKIDLRYHTSNLYVLNSIQKGQIGLYCIGIAS